MYSEDKRWRIISLIHIYDVDVRFLTDLFGPSLRTIRRWYKKFLRHGTVRDNLRPCLESRRPTEVVRDVEEYVEAHPTFFIEELKGYLQ